MDFHSLRRRDLQALCKKNRIPANITNVAMADALQALQTVEGLDELQESLNSQSPIESKATMSVPRQACRTSARRRPVRTKPFDDDHFARSLPQARRATTGNQEGQEGITISLLASDTMNVPFIKTPRQARSGTREEEVIREGPQEQLPDTPIATGEWKRPVSLVAEKAPPCVRMCYTRRRSSRKQEMKSTQEEEHKGVDEVVSPIEILGDPCHQTLETRGVVGRSIGFLIPCSGEYSSGPVEERVQSDPMTTGPDLCLGDTNDLTEGPDQNANPVMESKRIKIDPNPDNGSADLSKSRTTAEGDELKSQHCNLGVDNLKVEDEELDLQSQDLNVDIRDELPDLRVELREKDHELDLQNTVGGGCEVTYMDTDRPDQSTEVLIKGSDETSVEQPSQFMEENMVVVGTLDQCREDRIPEVPLEIADSKRGSSTNVQGKLLSEFLLDIPTDGQQHSALSEHSVCNAGVNDLVSPTEISGGSSHRKIEVRGVVERSVGFLIPCSGEYSFAPVEERSQSDPMITAPNFCHGDTVDLTEGPDQNAEPVMESKGVKLDPNLDYTSVDLSKNRTTASDELKLRHCNPGAENLKVVHEEFELKFKNLVVQNWNGSSSMTVGLREKDHELGVQNIVGGECEATDMDTDRLDQSPEILIKGSDKTSIEQTSEFLEENMVLGGILDQSCEDIIPTDMDADSLDQTAEILIKGSDETSIEQASQFLEENNMVVVGTLDQSREYIIPTDMDTYRLDLSAEILIKGSDETSIERASRFFEGNMVVVGTSNNSREDIIPTEPPEVLDFEGTSSNVQGKLQIEVPIEIQTGGDQHSKVLEHLVFQETINPSGPSDLQANQDNMESYSETPDSNRLPTTETLATNHQISSTSELREYSPYSDFINIALVDPSTKDADADATQANIESKAGNLIGFHDLYNEPPLEQIEPQGDMLLVNQNPAESKNDGIREEVGGEMDQSKSEKQNMEKTGLHSFSPCPDFINITLVDPSTKDADADATQANVESKAGNLIGFHDLYNEPPLEQIEPRGDMLLVNQNPAESKNNGIREEVGGEIQQSKSEKQNMEKTGLHSFSLRKLRSMYKESRETKCLIKLEPGCGRPRVQAELEEDKAENSGLNSLSLRKLKQIYKEKVARDDQCK